MSVFFDPSSFRDRDGRVFFEDNNVYRTLSKESLGVMQKLLSSDFMQKLIKDGSVIPTTLLNGGIHDIQGPVLQHEPLEFQTYPYEWSFDMLKDAALLTLNLMKKLLAHGYILKDGSSFNLTLHRGRMCFFDVLSIDAYKTGQVWYGYVQFTEEFLYPLMLRAYLGVSWTSYEPLNVQTMRALLRGTHLLKPGVFRHVLLQSFFNKSKSLEKESLKKSITLDKRILESLVDGLYKLINTLTPLGKTSNWSDYEGHNTYQTDDSKVKHQFIDDFSKSFDQGQWIIDLGANAGEFSMIASKYAHVISSDFDVNAANKLYGRIKGQKLDRSYVMVSDLMNPSPSLGWNLEERRSFFDRVKYDGFLALALIHHLCIAKNVPLEFFVKFLRRIAPSGVVEWVDKKDPMVQFLLRNREDIFDDYTKEHFEFCLKKYFTIEKNISLNEGHRTLYALKPLDV